MKKSLIVMVVVASTAGLICVAHADKRDDAKALAQKVVRFILEKD